MGPSRNQIDGLDPGDMSEWLVPVESDLLERRHADAVRRDNWGNGSPGYFKDKKVEPRLLDSRVEESGREPSERNPFDDPVA